MRTQSITKLIVVGFLSLTLVACGGSSDDAPDAPTLSRELLNSTIAGYTGTSSWVDTCKEGSGTDDSFVFLSTPANWAETYDDFSSVTYGSGSVTFNSSWEGGTQSLVINFSADFSSGTFTHEDSNGECGYTETGSFTRVPNTDGNSTIDTATPVDISGTSVTLANVDFAYQGDIDIFVLTDPLDPYAWSTYTDYELDTVGEIIDADYNVLDYNDNYYAANFEVYTETSGSGMYYVIVTTYEGDETGTTNLHFEED